MSGEEEKYQKTSSIIQPGLSKKNVMREYRKWQNSEIPYDTVMSVRGYNGPEVTAEEISKLVDETVRDGYRLLDIAAGTGLVAQELRKFGFRNIDALEPSDDMLKDAIEKQLYQNYYRVFMTKEPLPIQTDYYDGVVTCGGFIENHIPMEAVCEMIRIIKPGGLLVITTRHRYLSSVEEYNGMENFLTGLESQGKCRQLKRIIFPKYYLQDDGIMWIYTVL